MMCIKPKCYDAVLIFEVVMHESFVRAFSGLLLLVSGACKELRVNLAAFVLP